MPPEWDFELFLLLRGWGIRPSKKLPGGFARGGWSGLELTDTLVIQEAKFLHMNS